MKKILWVGCLLVWNVVRAQVVNYYPPPGMTYNFSTAAPAETWIASGAGVNSKRVTIGLTAGGNFAFVPLTDAGAVQAGNSFNLLRNSTGYAGLSYADTNGSATSFSVTNSGLSYSGSQGTFSMSGNDIVWNATNNTAPLYQIADGGTTGALSGLSALAGAASNVTGFFYCTGPLQTLGAGLTNGPSTGAYCQLSTGDQLFGATGVAPLLFGAGGVFGGMLDTSVNWILDSAVSHATNATNGFVYLGRTAGVPTGVPANLAGLYANAVPLRYDSTDNRLYAYNSGWKNIADTPTAPVLSGTTGSIGGGALVAGTCTSGTVAITNSTTAMAVVATPVTYPGDGTDWKGYISVAGTATVKVCALVAVTPTASNYNVRVLQ